ncbi:MAG: MFS transporter [Woeseia sp.]
MTLFKTSKLSMAGFAFPAMPLAAFLQSLYFFLTPLYAVEMGLGTAAVGGVFITAKMFDVVTDPLFGALSDRYPTPWGRRRPWLVLGILILMLAIYMLFMPSGKVGATYFLGWLLVVYVGWTLTTVSHTAWALELSPDYDQRTHITGWLQVSVMIGMMLVALTPAVLEQLAAPTHADKTAAVAWLLLILLPVSVFICLRSLDEPKTPPQPHIGLRRALAIVAGNWALLRLLLANAAITAAFAVVQSLFVFYVTYTLLLGDRTGFILFFLMVGGMIFIPVWVKLCDRFSKHRTVQLAVLYGMVVPGLLLFLPPGQLWLAVPAFLFVGAITSAHELLPRTMMADVCDHDQAASGAERMGLYYSLLQLSSKLAGGLMLGTSYTVLAWIGFEPGGENTQAAIDGVRYLIVFTPIAAYVLVLLLMWKYPIDRVRQQELRRIIEERSAP